MTTETKRSVLRFSLASLTQMSDEQLTVALYFFKGFELNTEKLTGAQKRRIDELVGVILNDA